MVSAALSQQNVSSKLCITHLVLVGTEAEMLDSLTRVLGTSQEKSVGSSWSSESQLVQSESFTSGCNNASAGSGSETEGRNTELGNGQEAVVISDGTDNDNSLVVGLLRCVRNNSRDRDGGSVDAGHEKAAEDDLVEGRLGTAYLPILAYTDLARFRCAYGTRSGRASRAT